MKYLVAATLVTYGSIIFWFVAYLLIEKFRK